MFAEPARALHRRQRRHVFLTGERGVGLATVLAEFARRAAGGRPPFLAEARVVRIDAPREHEEWAAGDKDLAELLGVPFSGRPSLVRQRFGAMMFDSGPLLSGL